MNPGSGTDVDGRQVAIVTGGASGIGQAIALELARNSYVVIIVDKDMDMAAATRELILQEGHEAEAFCGDISNYEIASGLVDEVVSKYGTPWLLVNNVGGDSPKPFLDTGPNEWESLINLNLKTNFNMTHTILPYMVKAKGGRIVNVSSDSARVGIPNVSIYATCKGGIISFTKCLAREMAPHGILINTICPGITTTPAVQKILDTEDGKKWAESIVQQIPLGRMGAPDDCAALTLFLAGPGAVYITGQTISVSGGKSMI